MAGRVGLEGALVVVTGAGSGIGRATATAFRAAGATVIATDRHGETAAETAVAVRGHSYTLDVADPAAVSAVAGRVMTAHGVPDVVVNNAGVGLSARFLDMEAEDWDWIVGVNLLGAVHVCRAFGPAMTDRGSGHVVNVSSGLAYFPRATEPAYCATKAALLSLSDCLRADWSRFGVGVSTVCPGVVNTPILTANTRFRGERAAEATRHRLEARFARGHSPDLVAAAVLRAVRGDLAVVPVGSDSMTAWLLRGLLPARLRDAVARADPDARRSRWRAPFGAASSHP
jgi:2-hydroxycyclohexanecarboxyl-CoA dehydrogenase